MGFSMEFIIMGVGCGISSVAGEKNGTEIVFGWFFDVLQSIKRKFRQSSWIFYDIIFVDGNYLICQE